MKKHTRDNPGVIAPPPLIYVVMFILGLRLQYSLPIPFLPRPLRAFLGGSLLGIGTTTFAIALKMMRNAGTNVNPTQPTTALLVEGPYKMSRNPIYLSLTLFYTGLSILLNTLWPLLLLPMVLIVMKRGVIEREERYLEQKFGERYLQYKESVHRWI